MRGAIALALFLAASQTTASEGYAIIVATHEPETAAQPTWIGLKSGEGSPTFHHFPANAVVLRLRPGRWYVDHIDYSESMRGDLRTKDAPLKRTIGFKVWKDTITYVGKLRVNGTGRSYRLDLLFDPSLLEQACQMDAEMFARFPVQMANAKSTPKQRRIRCET